MSKNTHPYLLFIQKAQRGFLFANVNNNLQLQIIIHDYFHFCYVNIAKLRSCEATRL